MEHNIFISYAWVDNEVYPGSDQGWVSTFVDSLRKHLAHELGRRDEAEKIWLDYEQMRGNQGVTPTIQARLAASRTLLLILSNGYVASHWCQQELTAFLARAGTNSDCLFVVQMSPVEQEPDGIQDLVKYPFWYLDDRRQPCTRWFPHIDPTDREYSLVQQKLARDIAAKLRELLPADNQPRESSSAEEQAPPAARAATPVVLSAVPMTEPPSNGSGQFVLVSGGEGDRELVHQIAKRLQQHNIGVAIPLSVLADQSGIKSSTLTRDLRTKLSLCDAVLMVYRSGPLDQVSQHLIECLKAGARTRRGQTPPTIDLCQTQLDSLALGLYPPGMRIHMVDKSCADDCVDQFLEGLVS